MLSLESNDLQKAGAQSSLHGLSDGTRENERFTEVKPLTIDLSIDGAGVFPSALQWDSVEKICRESNTDALFSLELFDAESKVLYGATPTNINVGIANIPAIEHHVNMTTTVKTGWRIYDPSSRTILDEYVLGKDISSSGSGINPAVAASALAGRIEAVKDVSTQAGQAYASRILPYWIRVSRDYFVKGDENFEAATRKARSGNWDGQRRYGGMKQKIRMAHWPAGHVIIWPLSMKLTVISTAQFSGPRNPTEDHNIRLALNYLNILRYRKRQNELLRSQTVAANN